MVQLANQVVLLLRFVLLVLAVRAQGKLPRLLEITCCRSALVLLLVCGVPFYPAAEVPARTCPLPGAAGCLSFGRVLQ